MASAFGHAYSAFAIGKLFGNIENPWKFALLGMLCAILPDIDVLSFSFGIAYEDFWGHRGFTHSLLFALITGILITSLFYGHKLKPNKYLKFVLYFTLCTASHSILDAMTSGGLGVAFFSPFNNERYFLPWRPIKVSPIGVSKFLSDWGLKVILSELIWIGIPSTLILVIARLKKNKRR